MKRKKNKKACHFTTPYHPYINSRIQTVAVEIVGLEDNSYHLIVPVEINGIQGDMIIDTGASVTVVDRQVFPEDCEICSTSSPSLRFGLSAIRRNAPSTRVQYSSSDSASWKGSASLRKSREAPNPNFSTIWL